MHGLGLDNAVSNEVITPDICEAIISRAVESARIPHPDAEIENFLRAGLQQQHGFSNTTDHPLGYGVLNGRTPNCDFAIDAQLPKDSLKTLEIFSNSYMLAPEKVSLSAWELAHRQIEVSDPHKLTSAPACKGSTKNSFFDDRTFAILRYRLLPRRGREAGVNSRPTNGYLEVLVLSWQ